MLKSRVAWRTLAVETEWIEKKKSELNSVNLADLTRCSKLARIRQSVVETKPVIHVASRVE